MASFLLFTPQPASASGMPIFSSSASPTFGAVGESVKLSCHFRLAPEDLGVVFIEWTIQPADISEEETRVIRYSGDLIHYYYDAFAGRVQFVSPDPASGNASISISDLNMTDTNNYRCQVTKAAEIYSRNVPLIVMEKPDQPECYAHGGLKFGSEATFRCRCAEGDPPVWYTWSMEGKMLPDDATVDSTQGDLFLTITKDVVPGILVCTAHNFVGATTCRVSLKPNSPCFVTTVEVPVLELVVSVFVLLLILVLLKLNGRRYFWLI